MRLSSIGITIVLVEIAVLSTRSFSLANVVAAFGAGIVGGAFAPVTRDIIAAFEKFRKPI